MSHTKRVILEQVDDRFAESRQGGISGFDAFSQGIGEGMRSLLMPTMVTLLVLALIAALIIC